MPLIVRKGNPAIGEQNGLPTWNGQPWPGGGEGGGDMYRLTYDANNNAKVDVAELADAVEWVDVLHKPAVFPVVQHTHPIIHVTNLELELNDKANVLHTHDILSINNLEENLTNKSNKDHTHALLHDHTNKSALDLITKNTQNALLWNNNLLPDGDMKKSIYDTDNDGVVDKAKTLHGLLASLTELNQLVGATDNIQAQINALSNVTRFLGTVQQVADLATEYPTPQAKDMVIVLVDLNHNSDTSIYIHNGTDWVYSGTFESEVRNFSSNPLNLASEVTGILDESNISNTLIRRTELTSSMPNIDDAVTKKHDHTNKEDIDKIGTGVDDKPTWEGSAWPVASAVTWEDIENKPIASVGNIDDAVNKKHALAHTVNMVTGLSNALDSKANLAHTHTIANVVDLSSTLASKASTSHTHTELHVHTNSTVLGSLSDLEGVLQYKGSPIQGGGSGSISWNDILNKPVASVTDIDSVVTDYNAGLFTGGGTGGASNWSELDGKPTSSPQDIDSAVSSIAGISSSLLLKSNILHTHTELHTHSNKAKLDAYTFTQANITDIENKKHTHSNSEALNSITTNLQGDMLWNGSTLDGDMKKAVYDTDNDGIIDKAKTLDGLNASLTELNYLVGTTSNLQAQLNALSNVTNYSGTVDTFVDISTTFTDPSPADMVIVLADETNLDKTTIYVYDGTAWVYSGEFKSEVRDFSSNALNLASETTGVLPETKSAPELVRRTEFNTPIADINSATSLRHNHTNKVLLDTYSATNADITDAVSKKHEHENIVMLNKIDMNDNEEPLWNGARWPAGDISYYISSNDLPVIGEINTLYAIYSDETHGSLSSIYVWNGSNYSLIGGNNVIIEKTQGQLASMFMLQATRLNVTTGDSGESISSINPKTLELSIAPTDEFKIPKIEVLKFVSGQENITTSLFTFDNADADDFEENENIIFDGVMKIKTQFEIPYVDEVVEETYKICSVTVDKTKFKEIISIV